MRTKTRIVGIVMACAAAVAAVFAAAARLFGWVGFAVCTATAALKIALYVRYVRPWHSRWGATDEEVARAMPGDDIIPEAHSTTRAISVDCPPEELWRWLVQIGYGRGGWYSYDWIDNDGKPSLDHIDPALQDLKVGDRIDMLPGFGPTVRELVPNHHFVAGDVEAGTWCLAIYPEGPGSRLVSRWRQNWTAGGLGAKFFISIADPGAFLMEQKMLRTLRDRAGRNAAPAESLAAASSSRSKEV